MIINGPHRNGNNELTLVRLDSPRKRLDGKQAHYMIEYVWRNENGGVQGSDYLLLASTEAKSMMTAQCLFNHVDLF